MTMSNKLAVLILGLFSYVHCFPYNGVASSVKEDLTQHVFQWKDQLVADTGLIKNQMKENVQAVMSGDPYKAVKTVMKNYIELAKVVAGHAMYNSFKSAHDPKQYVEKTIAEYESGSTTTSQPETKASGKPKNEDPVEAKTEVSDEIETETSHEPEIETSDKPETSVSDESKTDATEEPKTDTTNESDSEISKESEMKTLNKPDIEDSDEWYANSRDEQQSGVQPGRKMTFQTNMGASFNHQN